LFCFIGSPLLLRAYVVLRGFYLDVSYVSRLSHMTVVLRAQYL